MSLANDICGYVNCIHNDARFYLVGGTVRDMVMGVEPKDWDLVATGVEWDKLVETLRRFGKTEATGDSFNVIRHFPEVKGIPPLEIALPRTEASTGPKTTDVDAKYDPHLPIEEDLKRRDFSINSMAIDCRTGRLIDPYNGQRDIQDLVLRMLHPQSALDDPLRIIRGIRFMARYGLSVEPETHFQMLDNMSLLDVVSRERFQKELLEMLVAPHVDKALRYMQIIGALKMVLPELEEAVGCQQNEHHVHDVWEHTVQVVRHTPTQDPYVKLAALFHDIGKPPTRWTGEDGVAHFYHADEGTQYVEAPEVEGNHEAVGASMAHEIMRRLRFSARHADRVAALVREHMFPVGRSPKSARRLLNRIAHVPRGIEANAEALIAIRLGDLHGGKTKRNGFEGEVKEVHAFRAMLMHEIESVGTFKVTDLAVDGYDMMGIGLKGPEIGKALNLLLDAVIEDPTLNERETLLGLGMAK